MSEHDLSIGQTVEILDGHPLRPVAVGRVVSFDALMVTVWIETTIFFASISPSCLLFVPIHQVRAKS